MSSPDDDFSVKLFFYLSAGVLAGPFIFYAGFKKRKEYKLIEDIPTSKTRSVAMGLVEVAGTAESVDGSFLTSPFATLPCVHYRYVIEEERQSGRNRHWVTIAEGHSAQPFLLKDDVGSVVVDPLGAEFHLAVDATYQTGLFSGDADAFSAGLARLGLSRPFGGTLRCKETFVSAGDPLFVLGSATVRDGTTFIAKGVDGDFFCLSDGSEKDLLGSLKATALLCLYGGPALTVFCLYILFSYYFKSL